VGEVQVPGFARPDDRDAVDQVARVAAVGDPELPQCLPNEVECRAFLRPPAGDDVERFGRNRHRRAPGDREQACGVNLGERAAVLQVDRHN
jgi:hypothetical protein